VEVSELLGERRASDAELILFAEVFTEAFDAYCQRDFTAAVTLFRNALDKRPADGLGAHYLEQAQNFISAPPGPDWQGVLKLETK